MYPLAIQSSIPSLYLDKPYHESMHRRKAPKPSYLSYAALCELDDLRELDRLSRERP